MTNQINELQREVVQAKNSTIKEKDMITVLIKDQESIKKNFEKIVRVNPNPLTL